VVAAAAVAAAVVEALARAGAAEDSRPLRLVPPLRRRGPLHLRPGRVPPPRGRTQAQLLPDRAAQRPAPRGLASALPALALRPVARVQVLALVTSRPAHVPRPVN